MNPVHSEFALCWHRDDVKGSASDDEERAALAVQHYGVRERFLFTCCSSTKRRKPIKKGSVEYVSIFMSSWKGMIAAFIMQSPPRGHFALHCPWLTSRLTYSGAARPVQRHDRTSRSARYARCDTGISEAYVHVDRRTIRCMTECDSPSNLCCSRRNSILQQQYSSLCVIQPEQTAGDAACVHGRHLWWIRTGMQYTTAWSRMDEGRSISRDIRFERKANVGESCEDAGRVPWKRYRVFVGGMTIRKHSKGKRTSQEK